jgi:membrane protease YdiL (CAAX protease family)
LATSDGHRQRAEPRPWGLWATAGFAAIIAAAFIAVQTGTELVFWSMRGFGDGPGAAGDSFGLRVALATIMSAPVGVGLTVLFAAARRGISVRAYLAVNYPASRELWRQLGYLVVFIVAVHVVVLVLGRSIVTPFEQRLYETAQSPALLLFAIVLAAPVFEETFLRGFIFQGLLTSLGARSAIVFTALLWALLHVQYDLVEISMIFAGGLLLGYARLRANSILVPIAMHSLWNLSSAIETMIYLG